ncbi:hypothetical protein MUO66_02295 [Candidatus Bathyarchaeota archaeon]|nr:hypothetical protein [Candidatus Bathyarchaeota archaeon]
MQKTLKLSKQVFVHGLAIVFSLVVIQLLLDTFQNLFFLYMPPIGLAFLLVATYGIQPIALGVLNIVVLQRLYGYDGWQIGLWLNGFFLLLIFSTINLLIQTIAGVPFSLGIGILEIFLLSYPFGYLGKFSNQGIKTSQE